MSIEGLQEEPEQMLDKLVSESQGLLTVQALGDALAGIPEELRRSNQAQYLRAVVLYNKQHDKARRQEAPDWEACLMAFQTLQPTSHNDLDFYAPNYCFLAARNAGSHRWGALTGYFAVARKAAEGKDEEKKNQLIGFLMYNYARHLLQNESRTVMAKRYYIEAGKARVAYFESLRNRGVSTEEPIMQSAATQAWKIRKDWPAFFGRETIGECPVSEELFAELERNYRVNPKFSAAR